MSRVRFLFAASVVAVAVASSRAAPPVKPLDPPTEAYTYPSYEALVAEIKAGKHGPSFCPVLAVGKANPFKDSYRRHCTLPSGAYGIQDGVYSCYWSADEQRPVMKLWDNGTDPFVASAPAIAAATPVAIPLAFPPALQQCYTDPRTGQRACPR